MNPVSVPGIAGVGPGGFLPRQVSWRHVPPPRHNHFGTIWRVDATTLLQYSAINNLACRERLASETQVTKGSRENGRRPA